VPGPCGLRPHRQPALWPRQGQLERSYYRRGRKLGMRRPDIRVAGSPIEPPWPEFGPRWTELGLHWSEFGLYWTELGPGLNALERHPHCLNRAQTGHSLAPSRWSTVLASSSAAQARSSAARTRSSTAPTRSTAGRARSSPARVRSSPGRARSSPAPPRSIAFTDLDNGAEALAILFYPLNFKPSRLLHPARPATRQGAAGLAVTPWLTSSVAVTGRHPWPSSHLCRRISGV